MIRSLSPNILFLFEIKKCNPDIMYNSLMNKALLTNIHSVSCGNNGLGKDNGFTLLWSKDVNIFILDPNKNIVDFYILSNKCNMTNILWRVNGIYGYPKNNQ